MLVEKLELDGVELALVDLISINGVMNVVDVADVMTQTNNWADWLTITEWNEMRNKKLIDKSMAWDLGRCYVIIRSSTRNHEWIRVDRYWLSVTLRRCI